MIRGDNNCKLEENVITGVPDFFYPLTFLIDQKGRKWSETDKSIYDRRKVNTDTSQLAGGIDPTTGYSRRAMSTMSWVDFNRPVNLEDLPNYENWIAGIDANLENRILYQNNINEKKTDIKYTNESLSTIIITLSILVCLLIISCIVYFILK
jgi:hypothetical protein